MAVYGGICEQSLNINSVLNGTFYCSAYLWMQLHLWNPLHGTRDGFDLNPVHKLNSKEKKYWQSQDSNPRLLGGKQECFLCAMQAPILNGTSSIGRPCTPSCCRSSTCGRRCLRRTTTSCPSSTCSVSVCPAASSIEAGAGPFSSRSWDRSFSPWRSPSTRDCKVENLSSVKVILLADLYLILQESCGWREGTEYHEQSVPK